MLQIGNGVSTTSYSTIKVDGVLKTLCTWRRTEKNRHRKIGMVWIFNSAAGLLFRFSEDFNLSNYKKVESTQNPVHNLQQNPHIPHADSAAKTSDL